MNFSRYSKFNALVKEQLTEDQLLYQLTSCTEKMVGFLCCPNVSIALVESAPIYSAVHKVEKRFVFCFEVLSHTNERVALPRLTQWTNLKRRRCHLSAKERCRIDSCRSAEVVPDTGTL